MPQKSRNWCWTDFTLKIFTTEELKSFRYLCYGVEKCPRTQRVHHQGYLQFERAVTLTNVKKKLGLPQVHLEVQSSRSTVEEAIAYCKKDGDFKEFGEAKTKGQRSDILKLKKLIDEGKNEQAVADADFQLYCQYGRGLQKYRELKIKQATKDFRRVRTVLCMGQTNTGKTRYANDHSGFLIHASGLDWWDGYEQETSITIDEYANQIPLAKLLGILDGYQLRLPIKGGFTYANWTTVYITTNLRTLHSHANRDHQAALDRRITEVKQFPLPERDDSDDDEPLG